MKFFKRGEKSNSVKTFEAVATMTGAVVGAGILGIPYVIAQSGFLSGLITLFGVAFLVLFINLLYSEVILRTKNVHQISGYAEKYLGKRGFYIALFSLIFSGCTAILAYMLGTAQILVSIFGGNLFLYGVIYALIVFFLVHLGLDIIEESETFFTILIFIILAIFFVLLFGNINYSNLEMFSFGKIIAPYGVILFAFMGIAALPEMREELDGRENLMKRCVILGTIIPGVIYLVFAFLFVGVYGLNVDSVSTISLSNLGKIPLLISNIFAIIIMTTSFLAYGLAIKEMFKFDLNWPSSFSSLVSALVPIVLFYIFHKTASFTNILNITGIISGTIMMLLVLFMALRAKISGDRKPEYLIPLNKIFVFILSSLLVVGAVSLLI